MDAWYLFNVHTLYFVNSSRERMTPRRDEPRLDNPIIGEPDHIAKDAVKQMILDCKAAVLQGLPGVKPPRALPTPNLVMCHTPRQVPRPNILLWRTNHAHVVRTLCIIHRVALALVCVCMTMIERETGSPTDASVSIDGSFLITFRS